MTHIPSNQQLEICILASAMKNQQAANACFVELDDSDFHFDYNKELFREMKDRHLNGLSIDPISLLTHIKVNNLVEKIPLDLLTNMNFNFPVYFGEEQFYECDYDFYIEKLKNISSLRKGLYSALVFTAECQKPNAIATDVFSDLQNRLLVSLSNSDKKTITPQESMDNYTPTRTFIEEIMWRRDRYHQGLPTYEGICSGYSLLDDVLGSFQKSCFYIIGARTSMGKTTFMLNIISNMIGKQKIGIFSLEMPAKLILAKLFCIFCDTKYSEISKGKLNLEQINKFQANESYFKSQKIYVEDGALKLSDLISRAKRLKQNYNIDVLFIDFLTKISSDKKTQNLHQEVSEFAKGLQDLAKILEIPVICLAQLSRNVATRPDKRPQTIDLRESGSIEEAADAIIFLHRPEYYKPSDKPGVVEVAIKKNRILGELKTIEFKCNSFQSEKYMEIKDITDECPTTKNCPINKYENDLDTILMRN